MEKSGQIIFGKGRGGFPIVQVHTPSSDAEIYLHGAHVTHFQRKGEAPLLFLSGSSRFEEGQPIRGGVPIIFPWFGPHEGKAMHGFARRYAWTLNEIRTQADGSISLNFELPTLSEAAGLPKFSAKYSVTVGEALTLQLQVTNESAEDFSFEDCLHTYFNVGDISATSVVGLQGTEYLDSLDGRARKLETGEQIRFAAETDRVYVNTPATTEIHDAKWRRRIIVAKEESNSTVVWNPWIAKAKNMPDFGDEEYLRMVCVESGNVLENRRVLAPGKSSFLKVVLSTAAL